MQYLRAFRIVGGTLADEDAISSPSKHTGLSYRDAGVDIDAGNALVERLKPMAKATSRTGSMAGLGGFGAFFDPRAAGYKDPLLVSSTDGVGTKLKVAITAGRHATVGIDLVAMCVNDLVVQGAEPLFFLDYFATGKLSVDTAATVIAGIAEGCKQAGCALIGGETAEMPGMYADGEYDLAGFSVGAVERGQELTGDNVAVGDVLIGLSSSGVHSNGYSLVRRIVEKSGLGYDSPAPFDSAKSLGEALLAPTKIYVKSCLAAFRAGHLKALAHITGGGLLENIPRVLPHGVAAELDTAAWTRPPVFDWLAEVGGVAELEMARTFNTGLGMIAVVSPDRADAALALFKAQGETASVVGRIAGAPGDTPEVRLV